MSLRKQTLSVADHEEWMRVALREAEKAAEAGEIPVGAVMVKNGKIIGRGHNQREGLKDPTAHAEMIALSSAATTLDDWRLTGCLLYVTKEPCPMCAGAIVQSRIKQVIFGCYDEEEGCCGSLYQLPGDPRFSSRATVRGGILEKDCRAFLIEFFRRRRRR